MAKVFRIRESEARKRALVAESEVYRQTLTLEIQNLRLYGARWHRKLAVVRLANPLLLALGSLIASRRSTRSTTARKRRGKWSRVFGATLMGWRLYRQFGPILQALVSRRKHSGQIHKPSGELPVQGRLSFR